MNVIDFERQQAAIERALDRGDLTPEEHNDLIAELTTQLDDGEGEDSPEVISVDLTLHMLAQAVLDLQKISNIEYLRQPKEQEVVFAAELALRIVCARIVGEQHG